MGSSVGGKLYGGFCLFFGLLFSVVTGQSTFVDVSGIVFEDVNGNGIQEKGERPLPNVYVTDGVRSVASNAKGQYSLRAKIYNQVAHHFVSVTWPEGYWPSRRYYQLPFSGSKSNAHFGLKPETATQKTHFEFGVFGELHFYPQGNPRDSLVFNEIFLYKPAPAFMFNVLDNTSGSNVEGLVKVKEYTDKSPFPIFHSAGGNDLTDYCKRFFSLFGAARFSFHYGGWFFSHSNAQDDRSQGYTSGPGNEQMLWQAGDILTHSPPGRKTIAISEGVWSVNVPGVLDNVALFLPFRFGTSSTHTEQLVWPGNQGIPGYVVQALRGAAKIWGVGAGVRMIRVMGDTLLTYWRDGLVEDFFSILSPGSGEIGTDWMGPALAAYDSRRDYVQVNYQVKKGEKDILSGELNQVYAMSRIWQTSQRLKLVPGDYQIHFHVSCAAGGPV